MNVDVAINIAAYLGAVLTGSGVVYLIVRAKFSEVGELRRDMQQLRDFRIAAIEATVKALASNGCNVGAKMIEKMDNLLGWTKKMDGKLDRIAEETAAQKAEIAGQSKWLDNLDRAHNQHTSDRGIHHE